MKALRAVFVAVALIVMALPCALMPVMPSTLGAENRLPAEWPSLKTDEGKFNANYPDEYEAWLQDHVALRSLWIGLHSRILRTLGTSSQEMVVLGKGDWLFYRDMLNDYTGAEPLSENEIARMALVLDTVDKGLRAGGSSLTVAIIPNKGSIYPEQMLDAYPRRDTPSTLEQLKEKSHVNFVPMQETLYAQRDKGLYFHGDVHWNGLGARIGANRILEALSEATGVELPSPDPEDDYEIKQDWPGDLTRMLDPYSTECEPQQYYDDTFSFKYKKRPRSPEELTINTNGGEAPVNLLVLRDSFTNQMLEYIGNAAQSVAFLRAMPLPLKNGALFDAVLLEMVERRLPELLNAPPDMPAPTTDAPEKLDDAATVDVRLELNGRLYGALAEAPEGIEEVSLGVRSGSEETWYSAFPVSGVEEDGDRGFSAMVEKLPVGAEVCVYMRGETALRSDWTPVSVEEPVPAKGDDGAEASDEDKDAATNNLAALMKQNQQATEDAEDTSDADKDAATNNLAALMKQNQQATEGTEDTSDVDKDAATNNLAALMKQNQKAAEDAEDASDADKDAATNNLAELMKQAKQ